MRSSICSHIRRYQIYLSTYLSFHLSNYLFIYLSICLSIYISIYLSIYLSINLKRPGDFRCDGPFELGKEDFRMWGTDSAKKEVGCRFSTASKTDIETCNHLVERADGAEHRPEARLHLRRRDPQGRYWRGNPKIIIYRVLIIHCPIGRIEIMWVVVGLF